jgi:hypothetical protein
LQNSCVFPTLVISELFSMGRIDGIDALSRLVHSFLALSGSKADFDSALRGTLNGYGRRHGVCHMGSFDGVHAGGKTNTRLST